MSVGLERAGFDVTGVDVKPQPRYRGGVFVQADALTFPLEGYDFIWASPPCQAYTQMSARWRGTGGQADQHPDLIDAVRERLRQSGAIWAIENVPGARRRLHSPGRLTGGMFGLGVHRPRLFECSFALLTPPYQGAPAGFVGVYGEYPDGRRLWTRQNGDMKGNRSIVRCARSVEEARSAMGIDWMDWRELCEAIPPAMAEYVGRQARAFLHPEIPHA